MKAVRLQNEGMKLTKPAVLSDSAGFAAYPRCWADLERGARCSPLAKEILTKGTR